MSDTVKILSDEYIREICRLYGDVYDDRIEDSRPPSAGKKNGVVDRREAGLDWFPGMTAGHKSLAAFQRELEEIHGIRLSTSKIRKILVSGGCWTTERSREVQHLFFLLTQKSEENQGKVLAEDEAIREISRRLEISTELVIMNLPYLKVVNRLENRSKNAIRCERYRKRKAEKENGSQENRALFQQVLADIDRTC